MPYHNGLNEQSTNATVSGSKKVRIFGGRVSALFKVGVLNYRVRQISISKDFLSVLFNE